MILRSGKDLLKCQREKIQVFWVQRSIRGFDCCCESFHVPTYADEQVSRLIEEGDTIFCTEKSEVEHIKALIKFGWKP